jgi:hypothetical protein
MNTAIKEFTDEEVVAQMIPADGNDTFATRERLTRAAQQNSSPLAEEENLPRWNTEPSPDLIAAEMKNSGLGIRDAREKLRAELAADARLLESYNPEVSEEISTALTAASEAQARAAELIEHHQQTLDELKQKTVELCGVRLQIKQLRTLELDKAGQKFLANQALEFFMAKKSGNTTPQILSGWTMTIENLVYRVALAPHLPNFIEGLEKQAAQIIKNIHALATAEKLDLGRFIVAYKTERGSGGADLPLDETLFAGILDTPPKCA